MTAMTTELSLLFWSLPLYGLYLGAQSLIFRWRLRRRATPRRHATTTGREGVLLGRADRALQQFPGDLAGSSSSWR